MKLHLVYMGHPLCGVRDPSKPQLRTTTKAREVTCERCLKSMKRRNKDGDW